MLCGSSTWPSRRSSMITPCIVSLFCSSKCTASAAPRFPTVVGCAVAQLQDGPQRHPPTFHPRRFRDAPRTHARGVAAPCACDARAVRFEARILRSIPWRRTLPDPAHPKIAIDPSRSSRDCDPGVRRSRWGVLRGPSPPPSLSIELSSWFTVSRQVWFSRHRCGTALADRFVGDEARRAALPHRRTRSVSEAKGGDRGGREGRTSTRAETSGGNATQRRPTRQTHARPDTRGGSSVARSQTCEREEKAGRRNVVRRRGIVTFKPTEFSTRFGSRIDPLERRKKREAWKTAPCSWINHLGCPTTACPSSPSTQIEQERDLSLVGPIPR